VTVRGLRSRTSVVVTSDTDDAAAAAADTTTTFEVTLKGSTEFRTGEGWYARVHLMPIETDMYAFSCMQITITLYAHSVRIYNM